MKIFPLGFRTKIALWSAAASGMAVLAFSVTSAFIVFDNMREEADVEVRRAADAVLQSIQEGDVEGAMATREAQVSAEPAELHLVELIDSDGVQIVDEQENWPGSGEVNYPGKEAFTTIRAGGESWRLIARKADESKARAKLVIDLREITLEVTKMVKTYLWAMPVAMAIAALGGWWVAGRAAKPIGAIAQAAERISAKNFGRRVPELEETDEIARLATVLNQMIDRLQDSYRQAQRFSSDASHELRTPIAVLQGKIEQAVQQDGVDLELLAGLGEQVARLKSIVESLLLFSRADGGHLSVVREKVDLCELINEMIEDLHDLAEPTGIQVTFEPCQDSKLVVEGDERLLRIAIFNLLQNAVKYNIKEAGKIQCEASGDSEFIVFSVRNTGPPISDSDKSDIFERFYRGVRTTENEASGVGLGLSLARLVAQAHGGDVEFVGSEGGWNEFRLSLKSAM